MGFTSNKKIGSQSGSEMADIMSDNQKDPIKISFKVLSVKHITDNGFFVFEGEPVDKLGAVIINGINYYNDKFNIQGISENFGEHSRIGQVIDCTGHWNVHDDYGIQFEALFINERIPEDVIALEKYFSSGRIKGITPKIAKLMIEKWGLKSIDILNDDIDRLLEINGINEDRLKKIKEQWAEKKYIYEIVSYLGQFNISESQASSVYKFFNNAKKNGKLKPNVNFIDIIKSNPYILTKVNGLGFKSADKVGLGLGIKNNDHIRLRAALVSRLEESILKESNTCIPVKDWLDSSVLALRVPLEEIKNIAQELVNKREVILRDVPFYFSKIKNGQTVTDFTIKSSVSTQSFVNAEKTIAYKMKEMVSNFYIEQKDKDFIKNELLKESRIMDNSQRKAAYTVLTSAVSVLTGGPGTGKTTTLKNIVDIAKNIGLEIVLASPTGKAAKRMTESIGEQAQTIHRALMYQDGVFQYNKSNLMKGDLFIIDESSMLDTMICASWLSAIPKGSQIIFVGDADQLPSVGPGDVLRDLILSQKIPVARLTEIHRQSEGSSIAINAKLINEGKNPDKDCNLKTDDFVFIEIDNDEDIQDKIMDVIEELLKDQVEPRDIQVLSPQKTKEVGTEMLNSLLRWQLNPEAPDPSTIEVFPHFFNGERVMQTTNNYEEEIFNGDMGYVSHFKDDNTFIYNSLDNRKIVMNAANFKDLQMGYDQTVHKSQGSESPYIIMPISKSHSFTLNRNNIYTGITRAKKKVILIGQYSVLVKSISKLEQRFRTTGLLKEIKDIL